MNTRVKTLKEHIEILKTNPGNHASVEALIEALEERDQQQRDLIARINTLEAERNALLIRLGSLN